MSGPEAASKAAGGGIAISASDRKLISTVKEVVTNNTDEEIYAMLKECNRDPNEAAARLMNEEKFHVVKRKKDRKKESGSTKETSDSWQGNTRSGRIPGVSGTRTYGRGSSSLGINSNGISPREESGSRSKNVTVKAVTENGTFLPKIPSSTLRGNMSYSQLVQPKGSYANTLHNALPPSSGVSNGELSQGPSSSLNLEGAWPTSAGFGTVATLQGAWLVGAGHGTVVEMVKNGRNSPITDLVNGDVLPSVTSSEHLSSVQFQTVMDPMACLSLDSHHARDPISNVVMRESGLVGVPGLQADLVPYGLEDAVSAQYLKDDTISDMERGISTASLQPSNSESSMVLEQNGLTLSSFSSVQSHSVHADLQEGQEGQFSVSTAYEIQHYADSQQESTEWSSHYDAPPMVGTQGGVEAIPASPQSPVTSSTILASTTSMRDNHSVIIPDHIRVPEADCTMLNFGSFGSSFEGLDSNSTVAVEQKNQSEVVNNMVPLSSSARTPADSDNDQQIPSTSVQNLRSAVDMRATDYETSGIMEAATTLEQQAAQHEYPSSYSVLNAVSAGSTSHYAAVPEAESRSGEAASVPPPYDNSTYYNNAMFRASASERFPSLSQQLASSGKLGRPAEPTAQTASQETVNAQVYVNMNAIGGLTMPSVNNGAAGMTFPHQHSVHPYTTQPSGLPLGPFANVLSYPYLSPSFSYVPSPHQHNYVGGGNYHHQVPPVAVGVGGMKHPLPQYKTGGGPVSAGGMHNAISPTSLGYGGHPNTQPASNSVVTGANTSNFDDATPQHHYRDMYPSSQQLDGTSMWLQMQLAREAQGSSYYNIPTGQSQPTRYSQTQSMPTHANPAVAYGNVYHPQQLGGGSNTTHQLLQHQQALGSMGALGTQLGSYQQNQRAQPSWPSSGF